MCGISGIYHANNTKKAGEREGKLMRDTLKHRGPDGEGWYLSKDRRVFLGHRRLAIIDLSPAGKQPMSNEDGTIWITFNGEIYNFQKLRKELEKKGHRFKSKTDTETIVHAYEEYGAQCIQKLNGMFAFALWDERKKTLLLARDHVGIKPLYYAFQNGTLYFGSEIKAILAHPDFKKELDHEGISHYLTFGSAPAPFTLFKNIQKLPAANYLLAKNGSIEQKEYWNPVISGRESGNRSERDYIEETRNLLTASVQSQMVSDVPFGCFLSGGVDSSTNAILMSKALGRPVETFSVGTKHLDASNEFKYSRRVARSIGIKPHELLIDENDLPEFLQTFPLHMDDPTSDPICLPLFYLARFTRKNGVIVIQIGEGADEIFAGYDAYIKALRLYRRYWSRMEKFPGVIKRLLENASEITANRVPYWSQEYIQRLARNQEPFWGLAVAFGGVEKNKLLTTKFKNTLSEPSYEIIEHYYKELEKIDNKADFLKRMTYIEIKHRLPEFLLARADKMTMAHGVEGRVPFLDQRIVELALNMPQSLKLKEGQTKYILKRAVEGLFPEELQESVIWRKKQGFGTPINEWLRSSSPVSNQLTQIIFDSKIRERGWLEEDRVKKLIAEHQAGKTDHSFRIWNLITLSLWYDYWS